MIPTARLDLVPATIPTVRAALEDPERLGTLLDARVPPTWPPDLLDVPALQWLLEKLRDEANDPRWFMYWVLLRGEHDLTLIGTVGYKGHPDSEGTVEIGYGIVADHQRKGYATEAAGALVENALADPLVNRVIAETLPNLDASIGVMAKVGFSFIGDGSAPGVIRYELKR